MWNFRRPGENGMERTPSDAAAILFFLRKESEKNGAQKMRATNGRPYVHCRNCDQIRRGGHCPPDNPSVTAFAVTAPFTQGSLCPLRRGRADEGIGPYKRSGNFAR